MRTLPALLLALLTPLVAPLVAHAGEQVVSEDWYAVYVNDTKAGHAHMRVLERVDETAATPTRAWISTTELQIQLSRAGSALLLETGSRVEEDASGAVRSFRSSQKMSASAVVSVGRVEDGEIHLESQGLPMVMAYPEGALGPYTVDLRLREGGFEDGTVTRALAFSESRPATASTMVFKIGPLESRQVITRRLRLHRCDVSNSGSSARRTTMWLDASGRMHETESEVPGVGTLRMVRTSEKLALSVTSPAEIFSSSFVEPNRGIPSPRRTKRVVLRLSRSDGSAFDAAVIEGVGQSVAIQKDGSLHVTIAIPTSPERDQQIEPPVGDASLLRYLAPAPYLEIDDAAVVALARKAVTAQTDGAVAAAAGIEALVRTHVNDKSLDVGFATAAEVARTREGDCSEHAVLCAAVARAAGLPSRVVMGLVYVPGMSAPGVGPRGAFSYHMWSEVLVAADVWKPIDAAIGGYDATHLALSRSDLATSSPVADLILPVLEVIRDLEIEVLEVE